MKAKRNIVVLFIVLMAVLSSTVKSADFFTDRGSIWAGGSVSYANESIAQSTPVNFLMLSPALRFFPAKYFVLGPALSWRHSYDNHSYSGSYSLGPELGFAYGNHIHVVPYLVSGVQYMHTYDQFDDQQSNFTYKYGADGYKIPLSTGIMIPLMDGLGLQFEAGFTYSHVRDVSSSENMDESIFSFSVGICGIGKKTAISILNSFTGLL